MIENLQEKLHQGKRKQWKGAKISASLWLELECEKWSKIFCKIFGRQNIQNQNNTKHFSNPEDISNPCIKWVPGDPSTMFFLKKC